MQPQTDPIFSIVPVLKALPVIAIVTSLVIFLILMIRRNMKHPKSYADGKSIEASIFSKYVREKRDPNTLPYDKEYAYAATKFYYIIFETKNCERLELPVTSAVFQRLSEGDVGTLTYQGSQFIDFIQQQFKN